MNARTGKVRRGRGAAMIFALALSLCLTMLIVATQLEAVTAFKVSRTERDYERALQMAEAGANAYLYRLTFGAPTNDPDGALLPAPYTFPNGTAPSIQEFKTGVWNGTYSVIRYPAGSQQGYFAGTLSQTGDTVRIVSYGWSNGVVRRVITTAHTQTAPDDIDDDTDLHPSGEYSMFAITSMTIENNCSLYGGIGTNGQVNMDHNCGVYNGSIVLCGPEANATLGHNTIATVVRQAEPVIWPTVSQIAERFFPEGGLAWLATHNDNNMATINGVWGIPNSKIYATNNVTVVFRGKPGGANYYLTDAYFKNNATIRFDNTNGPVRVWMGPAGSSGGWYSKNNADFVVTSTAPENAPRLYMATTGGFTGKNNVTTNFGVYAYDVVNGVKIGYIETNNNMDFGGTFVANTVVMKNNAVITARPPFWQPLGGAYLDMSEWQE